MTKSILKNSPSARSMAMSSKDSGQPLSREGGFTTVSGGSNKTQKEESKALQTSKSVLYWRIAFCVFLAGTAAALGYGAYRFMRDAEERLARERFESISERALSVAQLVIEEKKKATDALALMMGSANPNADAWPNVYMQGYDAIATSLRIITQGSLSFCPLVKPGGEEQASFEAFAYSFFENVQKFPEGAGESAFGQGVFGYGSGPYKNDTWPDGRFHITSGWTYHYSPREILVPFLQSDFGYHSALMLNVHFEHHRAKAIDNTLDCSEARAAAQDATRECGSITDLMWSPTAAADIVDGPAGIMMVPIYPRLDNWTITGFILGKQLWSDLLEHAFESDVQGLDVVIRTDTNTEGFTYNISDGKATFKGNGTVVDEDFADQTSDFYATRHINPNFFSNSTARYYMDIYATDEFVDEYTTNNPRAACIGAVAIILGTSLLFFLYDHFVRKEFHDKRKLLEAKRQFVRFISHEVRTPLNTVCMGLTLLKQEFNTFLEGHGHGRKNLAPLAGKKNDDALESDLVPKVQEWMDLSDQVGQNAAASVAVLSDLLHYDKIQMGTLSLELSLMHIWLSMDKIVSEFKIAARESGTNLFLDLSALMPAQERAKMDHKDKEEIRPSDLPQGIRDALVVGDNVRLVQVFRNLLSNGLKFSQDGGDLIMRARETQTNRNHKEKTFVLEKGEEVTLKQRSVLAIDVIDQGVGMTREQVATVFQDGTQFNANKFQAGGGSGLGLSIARGIALEHGGSLSCQSSGMGKGTTFTLKLPLYDSNGTTSTGSSGREEETMEETLCREQDLEFAIPKLNILVVDDVVTNRKLCMRLLQTNGHTCAGACDGKEAVDMVKASMDKGEQYDCILLDYEMPVMKGPEACQKMRQMGCNSYIAGLTGNVMSEDVDLFRSCGANWVLAKPFRLEELEEQLIEHGVASSSLEQASADNAGIVRVESDKVLRSNSGTPQPFDLSTPTASDLNDEVFEAEG